MRIQKKASILYVLPMFTLREDVQKTILSIKNQIGITCDILCIDSTGTCYKKLLSIFSDLNYLVLKKHIGSAGGFRIGGEIACYFGYNYVIFGDDEVILLNNTCLQKMKSVLDTEKNCGAVGPLGGSPPEIMEQKPIVTRGLASYCMFLKTKVFNKVGFYNMELFWLGDDVDFSLRIAKYYKMFLIPQAQFFHPWLKPGRLENFSIYFTLRNLLYVSLRSPDLLIKDRLHVFYYFVMKLGATALYTFVFFDLSYLHASILAFIGFLNLKWPLHTHLLKNKYHMIPLKHKPKHQATLLGSFSVLKKDPFYYTYLQLHKKQYYQLRKWGDAVK